MDRSVDSIGSCSLDVDADSSDVSDTSSLNFATPVSAKDITREFTSKITERCQISQNTTTFIDRVSGQIHTIVTPKETIATTPIKKPSYLNLACCVNGYSNLTTYDSKVRQEINKSREVSPIRPSTNSIQHCKISNTLAPPIFISSEKLKAKNLEIMSSNHFFDDSNGSNDTVNMAGVVDSQMLPQQSFIQQRVERLYGPGALAQVFYSPKRTKSHTTGSANVNEISLNNQTEFCKKYQQFSSNKYANAGAKSQAMNEILKATNVNCSLDVTDHSVNNNIDLPVLRHLSQEFRAQLPSISPKRSYVRPLTMYSNIDCSKSNKISDETNNTKSSYGETMKTCLDPTMTSEQSVPSTNGTVNVTEKNGNHFLDILHREQVRLLELAQNADKYMLLLENNKDVSEEILGLLRSASGKARLLVSQKMKQFEGLCHNHLNRSPEDAFPTTVEDLQGFWDMVYLQVEHIDSIFREIEELKKNDWELKSIDRNPPMTAVRSSKTIGLSKAANIKQSTPFMLNGSSQHNAKNLPQTISSSTAKREAQRRQLMELKRKNKMAIKTNSSETNQTNAIEIFVHENDS